MTLTTIILIIVGILITLALAIRFRKTVFWTVLVVGLVWILYKLGVFSKLLGGVGI